LGGLLALAIELFLLPGFGVFGITGLLMVFLSLVLAGQTFVWPGTSAEVTTLASNLFWVAFLGFSGMVGLLFMHQRLEKLPMFRWLSLSPGGTDELEQLEQRESIVSYDYLLGQLGTTKTRLNPSGKAQFADDIISVVGSGGLIDEGVPVQVVEVRGNLVIVEECT
jgi:membrane-bound ClpP family serine protease